jgi:hypothetical protein
MLYDMPSDMLEVQNCTPVKIVFGQFLHECKDRNNGVYST